MRVLLIIIALIANLMATTDIKKLTQAQKRNLHIIKQESKKYMKTSVLGSSASSVLSAIAYKESSLGHNKHNKKNKKVV